MYIEDEELREIYRVTSTERLQKLESGLIRLEKDPDDRPTLEEFLREAHTLKGDSRMLGVQEVEGLMHQIEECLTPVKQGSEKITSELCDRLYQGIDAINKIVREAITGEPSGVNTFEVLAILTGGSLTEDNTDSPAKDLFLDADTPKWKENGDVVTPVANNAIEADLLAEFAAFTSNSSDISSSTGDSGSEADLLAEFAAFANKAKEETKEVSTSIPDKSPISQSPASNNPLPVKDSIDTIRVEPQKLDALMAQTAELNLIKLKLANRIKEVAKMVGLWEEWNRDATIYRLSLQNKANKDDLGSIDRLEEFDRRFTSRLQQFGSLLSQIQTNASDDTNRLETIVDRLESGVTNLRLLPLSTIFNLFPRAVRDLARQQGKDIEFIIEGGDIMADKRILEEIKDPLLHLIRNAVDHGIETPAERQSRGKNPKATLYLIASQKMGRISIEVIDDGRGLNLEAIQKTALRKGIRTQAELDAMSREEIQNLIFASGFSTRTTVTEISGRGIGMDVVRTNIERLNGKIIVGSNEGHGCQFVLQLSASISTTQVLIVSVYDRSYAIPIDAVDRLILLSHSDIFTLQGKQSIVLDNNPIPIAWLSDILAIPASVPNSVNVGDLDKKTLSCLILQNGIDRLALLVDAVTDQQNIVVKPPNKLLQQVPNLSGTTILGNGEICLVLNPQDLLAARNSERSKARDIGKDTVIQRNSVLLVEDSLVIRTQMKRILEGAGYNVTVAVDGLEGFEKLRSTSIDLVVSDVEMPRLSGLDLTAKIRQYPEYSDLPVILITTLAKDEDKRRGAEAGANSYLTKGDFDQKLLLETIERLI